MSRSTAVGLVAVDGETGTTWDPLLGTAATGPRAGEALSRLPEFTAVPWDFERLFPGGRVWEEPAR